MCVCVQRRTNKETDRLTNENKESERCVPHMKQKWR